MQGQEGMIALSEIYNRHKRWIPAALRRRVSLMRLRGINESVIAYHYLQQIKCSRTMIDVGAAHGSALRVFAGDGWKVWACEPNPENRSVLERVVSAYPCVTVWPYAISDKRQDDVSFFTSSVSSGLGSLTPFDPSHRPQYKVDIRTLADLFPDKFVLDFLKIDTEGYDLFVLKGVPWERMHPHLILCEFDNHKSIPLGYRMEDMAEYLQLLGYRVWVSESATIPDYGHLPEWKGFYRFGSHHVDSTSTGNLFAVDSSGDARLENILNLFETSFMQRFRDYPSASTQG